MYCFICSSIAAYQNMGTIKVLERATRGGKSSIGEYYYWSFYTRFEIRNILRCAHDICRRKRKGIECVLKLASVFKEKTCCFHISLYGDAENNLDWFQKQVMELNLTGLIDYYGEITDKQKVYDIIRQADVQLCFSKYDTYNVAIAESLVLGCPCIASNMCGAAYLINDYSAGLVVDLDEESAGNFGNIIEYINNIGNVESYGKTNNDYVDLLSWKNVVSQYLSLS